MITLIHSPGLNQSRRIRFFCLQSGFPDREDEFPLYPVPQRDSSSGYNPKDSAKLQLDPKHLTSLFLHPFLWKRLKNIIHLKVKFIQDFLTKFELF